MLFCNWTFFSGYRSGEPTQIEYLPAEHTLDSRVQLVIEYKGRPTTTIAVGDEVSHLEINKLQKIFFFSSLQKGFLNSSRFFGFFKLVAFTRPFSITLFKKSNFCPKIQF